MAAPKISNSTEYFIGYKKAYIHTTVNRLSTITNLRLSIFYAYFLVLNLEYHTCNWNSIIPIKSIQISLLKRYIQKGKNFHREQNRRRNGNNST